MSDHKYIIILYYKGNKIDELIVATASKNSAIRTAKGYFLRNTIITAVHTYKKKYLLAE